MVQLEGFKDPRRHGLLIAHAGRFNRQRTKKTDAGVSVKTRGTRLPLRLPVLIKAQQRGGIRDLIRHL